MTLHALESLTGPSQNHSREIVDFLSEGVVLYEQQLRNANREIRRKRARLAVLDLETERLREDAEQWVGILNGESHCAVDRNALRKLIEKSRGLAAVSRLAESLERDLAQLESRLRKTNASVRELREQLRKKTARSIYSS